MELYVDMLDDFTVTSKLLLLTVNMDISKAWVLGEKAFMETNFYTSPC